MKSISKFIGQLHNDEGGAALVEYTALVGIVVAAGVGFAAAVGGWVAGEWTGLCTAIGVTC